MWQTARDARSLTDAQGLLVLVLLFPFSSTECPCLKTWAGNDNLHVAQLWKVADSRLMQETLGTFQVCIQQDACCALGAVAWADVDEVIAVRGGCTLIPMDV